MRCGSLPDILHNSLCSLIVAIEVQFTAPLQNGLIGMTSEPLGYSKCFSARPIFNRFMDGSHGRQVTVQGHDRELPPSFYRAVGTFSFQSCS
jgi:hypothetical protein